MITDEEVLIYLEHHGIKGQRWGVRRNLDKTARREAKAQKYVKKAESFRTQRETLAKKTPRTSYGRGRQHQLGMELRKKEQQALEDAERKREGKLSKNQKRAVIGGAAAAVILAAYGTRNAAESGRISQISQRGKPWKYDESLTKKMSPDDIHAAIVRPINEGYGAPGTKVNCRRCTFAYEMRRRGNDVAATRTTSGRGQTNAGLFNALDRETKDVGPSRYSMAKRITEERMRNEDTSSKLTLSSLLDTSTIGRNKIDVGEDQGPFGIARDAHKNIFDRLSSEPDGSRGELGVIWRAGGAHSVAYEIIDNKPVIFDTRSGKRATNYKDFAATHPSIAEAGFTRLDDQPLDSNFLARWVKNAKS